LNRNLKSVKTPENNQNKSRTRNHQGSPNELFLFQNKKGRYGRIKKEKVIFFSGNPFS